MDERFRQADRLQVHPVDDGYVVRHEPTGVLHHLNGTAALLFELCDGKATADEIVGRVRTMFRLTPRQARAVKAGLDTLRRSGLVTSAPFARHSA